MPGRLRTGSRPSRTWMDDASYEVGLVLRKVYYQVDTDRSMEYNVAMSVVVSGERLEGLGSEMLSNEKIGETLDFLRRWESLLSRAPTDGWISGASRPEEYAVRALLNMGGVRGWDKRDTQRVAKNVGRAAIELRSGNVKLAEGMVKGVVAVEQEWGRDESDTGVRQEIMEYTAALVDLFV